MTRYMVTVTIENLATGQVNGAVDVPEHLAEHWSLDQMAEWAIGNDDEVAGMAFHYDETMEPVPFGENGSSLAYFYRVGARHLLCASVVTLERRFTVVYPDDTEAVYSDETMAVLAADIGDGILGIREVVA